MSGLACEREGLLAGVLEAPGEDAPRLIYADWLEDNGDVARGEFIRVQCELDRPYAIQNPSGKVIFWRDLADSGADRRRERDLLLRHGHGWLAGVGIKTVCHDGGEAEGVNYEVITGAEKGAGIQCDFRRGFVEAVTLPLAAWYGGPCPLEYCEGGYWRHSGDPNTYRTRCHVCAGAGRVNARGPALLAAHPITGVRLSDRHAHLCVGPGDAHWCGWVRRDVAEPDCCLPPALYDLLGAGVRGEGMLGPRSIYPTTALAEADLSEALLAYARGASRE